jgi:hypothetical protein
MGLVVLRVGARRARRVLLLAGLVFAVLPAGSALADTTIGQTGGDPNNGCFAGALLGDRNYEVPPGGGTITSFSFQSTSANTEQTLDFVVLRPMPSPGSQLRYLVVGKTGAVTLKGTGLETFPANISVRGGDILGLWSFDLNNCFRAGPRRLVLQDPIADPNTGDLVDLKFAREAADLNESANLAPSVGAPPPPTSKAQCQHGGWKDFGSRFKNQGQCVRFVNHQKKHHHKHHPSGFARASLGVVAPD